MRTAGLVLDFYDDPDKGILKSAFPTIDAVPDLVKTAHFLTPEQLDVLRDEGYALILENEGKVLRKFACVDGGNTFLSALYLERNHEKLPSEAVKVAAANIISACEQFGVEPTPFLKEAAKSGMSRKRDPMQQPYVGDESDWASRTNLNSGVQGSQAGGRVMDTVSTMKTASNWSVGKSALQGGVGGAALGAGIGAIGAGKGNRKKGAVKGALIGGGVGAAANAGAAAHLNRKGIPMPGTKVASVRRVDVSGLEPEVRTKTKTASRLALGRYPLDSFADVEAAVRYFDERHVEMDPADRHEYAVKTASRADELGIATSDLLDRYGSTEYAPDVDAHIANRRAQVDDPKIRELYTELQEKRAAFEPTEFVEKLAEIDEIAGLNWYYGGAVADPYFATFGGRGVEKAAGWSWQDGMGTYVTEAQLKNLATNGRQSMTKSFSDDLVDGFQKDPVKIFESLPATTKVLIARLANDAGSPAQ